MPRLNKTQTYAIRWLYSQNQKAESIAEELGIDLKDTIRSIEKFGISENKNNIKDAKNSSKSKDLMINQTSAKKNNHVAIMTKEASEYNDSVRSKSQINPNTQKAIFRPKNNE